MTCKTRERGTMKFANGVLGVAAVLGSAGAWGQTTDCAAPGAKCPIGTTIISTPPGPRVDTRPFQMFYLTNATQQNEANEIVVAVRNLIDPSAKIYLVPSQNAIAMRGSPEELALAQKVINDLDKLKKSYRLTYTITELDGGKRVGVQHYSMIVTDGQRSVMKQGNKIPVVTGSYSNGSTGGSGLESQVTYLDIGMNFDATLDAHGDGGRLRTKVEQLGMAEEKSGVGPQDPIVRQSAMESTVNLAPGKPVVLGSLDVPGSTRHLDVDVMMEPL
jgi:type II secretory pathway component GspD/PulD (secretin)